MATHPRSSHLQRPGLVGRDILLLYGPPWNDPTRLSKHHLASYLARHNRVLYVESSLHPLNVLARPRNAVQLWLDTRGLRKVEDNLWVRRYVTPVPYHSVTPITASRSANRLAQRWISTAVRRDLLALGMRQPIVIAGLPHAVDLLPYLQPATLIYHCADEYRAVPGFPHTLPALEAELVRAADLVVVTAESLLAERKALNQRTHWIPNGVDVAHFSSARLAETPVAGELQRLRKPVAGFIGALAMWLDQELVARAADALPDWSFVLVGPVGAGWGRVQRPNLHLLGPRPYPDLPTYLKGFDVAMIPFRTIEVSRKADPIKAYEYLAAGLPVVATDLPALKRFGGLVETVTDASEFVEALKRASQDWSPARAEARQAEARNHSWESRFELLASLVMEAA